MEISTQAQLHIARWRLPTLKIGFFVGFAAKFLESWRVRRERQLLASLDERMLKDIGLSRADVVREASRSSWDCERIDRLSQ
jgi:uncharacterized protein YjiS (DUF1127 family)